MKIIKKMHLNASENILKKIYMIFYKNKQQGEINLKKLKP